MAGTLEEQKRPEGKEQKVFMEAGSGSWERRGKLNRQKRRWPSFISVECLGGPSHLSAVFSGALTAAQSSSKFNQTNQYRKNGGLSS